VTSKKKPLSVEIEETPIGTSPKDDSSLISQTMRLRAEFSVQAGSKKFNPVTAATGLFSVLLAAYPSIKLTNVAGTKVFDTTEEIPTDNIQFEQQFQVSPHLGRTGGGKIHLHFRISKEYTIDMIKQQPPVLHYLQRN